jgi:hypothetical protein
MKLLNKKILLLVTVFIVGSAHFSHAQQGRVVINQDPDLVKLLALKKDINLNNNDSDRYKIQIFSGDRKGAEKAKANFNIAFYPIPSDLVFETPNYKVWVGNFRSRLEADRSLVKVQKEFQNAFVFKPKKEKEQ